MMVAGREARGPWPRDPDGVPLYPGSAKTLPQAERERRMAAEPYALRLDMGAALARLASLTLARGGREELASHATTLSWSESGAGPDGQTGIIRADPAAWGDVILARKDTPTSYHLAVVVDDAAQGVTDVVRGQDLYHSTSVHRLLQNLLALPEPRYHHHRLVPDADGKKLSKSTAATGLRELRAAGASAADIRHRVGLD